MGQKYVIKINLMEVLDNMTNDKDFNVDLWCEGDAIILERLAGLIRRELEEKKNQ